MLMTFCRDVIYIASDISCLTLLLTPLTFDISKGDVRRYVWGVKCLAKEMSGVNVFVSFFLFFSFLSLDLFYEKKEKVKELKDLQSEDVTQDLFYICFGFVLAFVSLIIISLCKIMIY